MKRRIKAVLFDMDGLMFDTETLATKFLIKAAANQGYKMTKKETNLVLGYKVSDIYDFYEDYFYKNGSGVDGRKLVDDHYNYLENHLLTLGPDKMPNLEELLIYLKDNGYKVAVASSSDIFHIKNNLEKNNLEKYIDVISSGEEVENGKPEPDVFLLAAKRLGVMPYECIVLEDSPFGVEAGARAGMTTIMIPDSVSPSEEIKSKAYSVLNNLGEVPSVIESLNNKNTPLFK